MKDEIWTQKDGTKIAVGDMTEEHVRNALRMILRKARQRVEADLFDFELERPDNHAILAELRRKHGDQVRVKEKGVAGLSGGDVFVGDTWVGWFGGI